MQLELLTLKWNITKDTRLLSFTCTYDINGIDLYTYISV